MKVFCSGSCRLLTTITKSYDKIYAIHSMYYNFLGVNFLGKLHNTQQHIQFIKYIKGDIVLPEHILPCFLTSYNKTIDGEIENIDTTICKVKNLKDGLRDCTCFIFEICSIKLYKKEGFHVQYELVNDYNTVSDVDEEVQTEEDVYNDLKEIRNLISLDKKIIFQCHFRPNIIYNDTTKAIQNRETIYNACKRFCNENENTVLYDPSLFLHNNHEFFDGGTHFTDIGYEGAFNYIYDEFINK